MVTKKDVSCEKPEYIGLFCYPKVKKTNEGEMGSVYDRTEKEYYHNKRHRCTCRDTGILLPNCGQGQLLPDAVFLSAQLYLYRSVRRLGALRPSADRAKAGVQVYDGHRGTAHHMDGSPFGKVFYILAAECRPLPVVSVLSAHAVCAYAGAADRHVIGKAGRIQISQGNVDSAKQKTCHSTIRIA